MPLALLTFLSGLAISAVAIYYSVLGLASIFSAAVVPIIIMGTILELSKLVSTWWLKSNWNRAPFLLKSYMLIAVVVLMLITSMGIFGFLSKAHSDQSLVSGDVVSKVSLIDEKIKIERENIADAQSLIKQMDAAVTGVIATGDQEIKLRDGSTQIRSAAERSLQIRRSQSKDRAELSKQIEEAQGRIVKLQEEAAPIRAEIRKVEAEVGPIKYIAKLIYGDNTDNNLLEKAVTWVIITIVFVFDPLAILLLLASQMSFQWAKESKEQAEGNSPGGTTDVIDTKPPTVTEQQETTEGDSPEKESDVVSTATVTKSIFEQHPYLLEPFVSFKDLKPMVYKAQEPKEIVDEPETDPVVEEALKWADEQKELSILREEVKKYGYSKDENGIKVHDKLYTQEEFDLLMGTGYVQNEEQTQSGVWSKINSKITEEEYIKNSTMKTNKNDNPNNAT
jgi:hypothetical protein